ncbi:MAG: aminotransferase class I/II-fold pyridoxal phosphate-dependent enzyme, partial [Candidatus Saccharibacteria bacterium]|nr:aminotransferase class I/II-fold pyridoxal phosphate-dependent enzyme [Pseudorhodobacter sp.]
ACLQSADWRVEQVSDWRALAGADLAGVVNPNNPGGQVVSKADLLGLLGSVGRLVVDESFADATPEMSVAGIEAPGLIVLRSFGKFYGLAGVRLGFVIGSDSAALAEMAGPWAVSGAAIEIGTRALSDQSWSAATVARLRDDVARLDRLVGWPLVGGTALFRLYRVDDAAATQDRLARHGIWSRIFPYSRHWIRLGLPGSDAEFVRLSQALGGDP